MAVQQVNVSDSNKNMREVTESSPFMAGPETGSRTRGVVFEGLGNLEDFPTSIEPVRYGTEEAGEHVVVLHSILVVGEASFIQGDVRPISRFVPTYLDEKVPREEVKASIKRLFELGAVRLATKEEAALGHIEIDMRNETDGFANERSRRIQAEREADEMRRELEALREGKPLAKNAPAPEAPKGPKAADPDPFE